MNWTGNMKCEDADQVLLLLKSSDCVMHDLIDPFDHCEDGDQPEHVKYVLVLRKWEEILPSSEFRCFVSHDRLVGVSQRAPDQYFPYLQEYVQQLEQTLERFFEAKLRSKFSSHSCGSPLVSSISCSPSLFLQSSSMSTLRISQRGSPVWCWWTLTRSGE